MTPIRNKNTFPFWAKKFYGRDDFWYDERCISTYGKEQLSKTFNITYVEVNNKQFNSNNIDKIKVYERALKECKEIIETNNPDAIQERTNNQILDNCIQSQYAEIFLLENGFTDCKLKYHDVIDQNGLITEVKTSKSKEKLDQEYIKYKNLTWHQSKRMIAFYVENNNYTLYFDKFL